MSTKAVPTDSDLEKVLRYLKQPPQDRNTSDIRDIRKRAEQARAEIRQRHGVLDVAGTRGSKPGCRLMNYVVDASPCD